ncbi:fungal-specific transcription factor domain-containing protein, partial [Mycena leptocephala]
MWDLYIRLKIKCDKQIPCHSCVRRNCSALCPNNTLVRGATEHLHREIRRMGEHIRILEDALVALHAGIGGADGAMHPLLLAGEDFSLAADDSPVAPAGAASRMGEPWEVLEGPDSKTAVAGLSAGIDAGTLSISDHGTSCFFGPTGGTEVYAASSLMSPAAEHTPCPSTVFSSSAFPLTPIGPQQGIHALISHLPARTRARMLVNSYFSQLAWFFRGVTRGQVGDMLHGDVDEGGDGENEDYTGPHDLALLFIVFAVGTLVQPKVAEAEHLHQIATAALALQPVLEKPSLVTIQALQLLSIYTAMVSEPAGHSHQGGEKDAETCMEMTWSLVTLAAHLSQTIGLHRDSARWGLSATMVQRRRILFWDLFVADVWQSLNTGRPPSFSLAYIDCSFPRYEGSKAKDGSWELWMFRFAAECVADVAAGTLAAEAPSYATIMELDRKVHEFPLPLLEDAAPDDVGASLQRCVLEHIRETVLMYIHRFFFAQAIIEQPVNPLKSTYAPSFLATYRAGATILKSVREQFALMPHACARFWTMWTFAFGAAVVFGTVVTRGPSSPLAAAAMAELKQACVLFSKAAVLSRRATKALSILTKLSEKARFALAAAQNDPSPGENGGVLWNTTGPEDELSILAGHTRFVS